MASSQLSWLVFIIVAVVVVVVFIFIIILLLLFVIIHFFGVTCGGDEGGEGNPPRPAVVVDESCTERCLESVSQSSENVKLDADTRRWWLRRGPMSSGPTPVVAVVEDEIVVPVLFIRVSNTGYYKRVDIPGELASFMGRG